MTLISLRELRLSYGAEPLLDGVNLTVERGDRLCVLGRNGSGKSTLLKLLAGEVTPDDGEVVRAQGLTTARLEQEVPPDTAGPVADVVVAGLGETGKAVAEYLRLNRSLQDPSATDEATVTALGRAQSRVDADGGWALLQRVDEVLTRLGLDGQAPFAGLSGGMKRRVLLARALAQQADVLLLDEPTNHLDLEAIAWLESFLLGASLTLVFITHDRALVRAVATRIAELERGALELYPGDYDTYLREREARLAADERARARFDRRLSEEERWIRQGIKARRTRNEGRVRALKAMRDEFARRRARQGQARIAIAEAEASGRLVIEAEDLGFGHGDTPLASGFSTTILRGDRIGLIGPNGCGKSTLLRVLLGEQPPMAGRVRHGTRLAVAYFDQLRESLDEASSVRENVADGAEWIDVNGRQVHVMGYLRDFLFAPDRAHQPVSALSGGERNRLLLARLFTRECNLLVLDEPTNDLDSETLELLEERLIDYQGTLIVVSHDREFLDNVVTRTIVFEHGAVNEYVGGYTDWQRQRAQASPPPAQSAPPSPRPRRERRPPARSRPGYAEQRELDQLPARIEELENRIQTLQARIADPALHRTDPEAVAEASAELARTSEALEAAYERWEALETMAGQPGPA